MVRGMYLWMPRYWRSGQDEIGTISLLWEDKECSKRWRQDLGSVSAGMSYTKLEIRCLIPPKLFINRILLYLSNRSNGPAFHFNETIAKTKNIDEMPSRRRAGDTNMEWVNSKAAAGLNRSKTNICQFKSIPRRRLAVDHSRASLRMGEIDIKLLAKVVMNESSMLDAQISSAIKLLVET